MKRRTGMNNEALLREVLTKLSDTRLMEWCEACDADYEWATEWLEEDNFGVGIKYDWMLEEDRPHIQRWLAVACQILSEYLDPAGFGYGIRRAQPRPFGESEIRLIAREVAIHEIRNALAKIATTGETK